MQDVLSTQNRMPDESSQEILEQSLPSPNDRRVLFRLALALDGVLCQTLFRRDGRDDEDRIQSHQRLMQRQKRRIPPSNRVRLSSVPPDIRGESTHPDPDHICDVRRSTAFGRLERIDNTDLFASRDIFVSVAAEARLGRRSSELGAAFLGLFRRVGEACTVGRRRRARSSRHERRRFTREFGQMGV